MWASWEAQQAEMRTVNQGIEGYLAALAAEGKARCTVEVYGARLRRFADLVRQPGKDGARGSILYRPQGLHRPPSGKQQWEWNAEAECGGDQGVLKVAGV